MDCFNLLPTGRVAQGFKGDILSKVVSSSQSFVLTNIIRSANGTYKSGFTSNTNFAGSAYMINHTYNGSTTNYTSSNAVYPWYYDWDGPYHYLVNASGTLYSNSFDAARISGKSEWITAYSGESQEQTNDFTVNQIYVSYKYNRNTYYSYLIIKSIFKITANKDGTLSYIRKVMIPYEIWIDEDYEVISSGSQSLATLTYTAPEMKAIIQL